MTKTIILWVLTLLITLSSAVYQRMTGPSHSVYGKVEIDGRVINYELLRSFETVADARMEIDVSGTDISGELTWKRFKSNDTLITQPLTREGDNLIVIIPKQPMAGKVIYSVSLFDKNGQKHGLSEEPIIIRFRRPVPLYVLIPHIFFMFFGMMLATRAGFEAILKRKNQYNLTLMTIIALFIGGIILGPIVQKFAFDAYWTGWPIGHDLTDNKTIVAWIFWLIALWRVKGGVNGRLWVITASIVTLIIFLIPHSLLGSEIDYTKNG